MLYIPKNNIPHVLMTIEVWCRKSPVNNILNAVQKVHPVTSSHVENTLSEWFKQELVLYSTY